MCYNSAKFSIQKGVASKMGRIYLLWASLIILIGLAIIELWWLSIGGLAWTIVIAVAVCLQLAYLLSSAKVKPLYAGLLVVGILMVVVGVKLLAPDLTAHQVKAIINEQRSDWHAVSAYYKGQGIWEVKVSVGAGGWLYFTFDENAGKIIDIRK